MKKRIISMLLVCLMIVSLFPMGAVATADTALPTVDEDGVITLTNDVTLSNELNATSLQANEINLAGHKLTISNDTTLTVDADLKIVNSVSTDGGIYHNGIIVVKSGETLDISALKSVANGGVGGLIAGQPGSLTIENGATVEYMTDVIAGNEHYILTDYPRMSIGEIGAKAIFAGGTYYSTKAGTAETASTWVKDTAPVAKIGDQAYTSLAAAIAAVNANGTVKLLADVAENVTIPDSKTITLDLNGKTLNGTEADKQTIINYGALTITDNSNGTVGTVTNTNNSDKPNGHYVIDNYGTLIIEKGEITNNTSTADTHSGSSLIRVNNQATLTVEGGEIHQNYYNAIKVEGGGTATITGGTIETITDYSILTYGTLTVSDDAVISGPMRVSSFKDSSEDVAGNATLNGGTFNGDIKVGKYNDGAQVPTLTISGGTYYGNIIVGQGKNEPNNFIPTEGCGTVSITGGAFTDLASAVKYAQSGKTIKLADDVALASTLTIPAGKNLTINFDEKTISDAAGLKDYLLDNKGTLTLTGGTITDSRTNEQGTITTIRNLGTLDVTGMTITRDAGIAIKNDENGVGTCGTLTVTNSTVSAATINNNGQAIQNWGNATINSGTFTGDVNAWAVKDWNPGNTIINGGMFNGAVQSIQRLKAGSAWPTAQVATTTIKGGTFKDKIAVAYRQDGASGSQPTEVAEKPEGVAEGKIIFANNASIVIDGATANGGKTALNDGITLVGDGTQSVTVKNFTFTVKGLDIKGFKDVTVQDNTFNTITTKNRWNFFDAMVVAEANGTVVISNNSIDGANEVGINCRDISGNLTITGNTVKNTSHNSLQIVKGNIAKHPASLSVTGNTFMDWGKAAIPGKSDVSGRALRGEVGNFTFTGNKMTNANAPEEFVKITKAGEGTIDASGNYWGGNDPTGKITGKDIDVYLGIAENKASELKSYYTDAAKTNLVPLTADDAVAEIDGKYYATLAAAVAAANNEDSVKLLKDVPLSEQLTIGKAITLDGGNHTITSTAVGNAAILVNKAAATIQNLTVSGPNTTKNGWDNGEFGIKFYQATGAKLDNVKVTAANAGVQVNGGSVTMTGEIDLSGNEFGGIELCHGGVLNISAATLKNDGETDANPVLWNDDAKGNITFNANQKLYIKAADAAKDHYYLSGVAAIGTTGYRTLAAAVAAAASLTDPVITLLANVDIASNGVTVPANTAVTLDLNGHSIKAGERATNNIKVAGKLTLQDSVENSSGKIYTEEEYIGNVTGYGLIRVSGEFVMNSGKIETAMNDAASKGQFGVVLETNAKVTINGGEIKAGWYAVNTNGTPGQGGTQIVVNGGTLISTADYAIYNPAENSTVKITGGTIYGAAGGISMNQGDLTVEGGMITSKGTGSTGTWGDGTGGQNNAAINIEAEYGETTANISGGTITAEGNAIVLGKKENGTISITGGTFSSNVSEYVAKGYECTGSTGSYTVAKAPEVAVVTEVGADDIAATATDGKIVVTGFADDDETKPSAAQAAAAITEVLTNSKVAEVETKIEAAVKSEADATLATELVNAGATGATAANITKKISIVPANAAVEKSGEAAKVTAITFDVKPVATYGDKTVTIPNESINTEITFRLPVPDAWAGHTVEVKHTHEGVTSTEYALVQGTADCYVELKSSTFSEWNLILSSEPAVAKVGDKVYTLSQFQDAMDAATTEDNAIVLLTDIGGLGVDVDGTYTYPALKNNVYINRNGKEFQIDALDESKYVADSMFLFVGEDSDETITATVTSTKDVYKNADEITVDIMLADSDETTTASYIGAYVEVEIAEYVTVKSATNWERVGETNTYRIYNDGRNGAISEGKLGGTFTLMPAKSTPGNDPANIVTITKVQLTKTTSSAFCGVVIGAETVPATAKIKTALTWMDTLTLGDNTSKTYDGQALSINGSAYAEYVVQNGETGVSLTVETLYYANEDDADDIDAPMKAGTYYVAFKATDSSNTYDPAISDKFAYTIIKKTLTMEINVTNAVYDGKAKTLYTTLEDSDAYYSVTGLANYGENLSDTVKSAEFTCSTINPIAVGDYTVTCTLKIMHGEVDVTDCYKTSTESTPVAKATAKITAPVIKMAVTEYFGEYKMMYIFVQPGSEKCARVSYGTERIYDITDLGYKYVSATEVGKLTDDDIAENSTYACKGYKVFACLVNGSVNGAVTYEAYNKKIAGSILEAPDIEDVNYSHSVDIADAVVVATTRNATAGSEVIDNLSIYMASILRADVDRNGKVEIASDAATYAGDAAVIKNAITQVG